MAFCLRETLTFVLCVQMLEGFHGQHNEHAPLCRGRADKIFEVFSKGNLLRQGLPRAICPNGSTKQRAHAKRQHRWKETSRFAIQVVLMIVKMAEITRKGVPRPVTRRKSIPQRGENPDAGNTAIVTEDLMPTDGRRRTGDNTMGVCVNRPINLSVSCPQRPAPQQEVFGQRFVPLEVGL